MAALTYHYQPRGFAGFRVGVLRTDGVTTDYTLVPAMALVDSSGADAGTVASPLSTQSGVLPVSTDRSGTAATTSGQTVAANATRRGLNIQNIGANNIGVNEFGGTAAIGTAGTYTLAPGATMNVRTRNAVTMIAATAATAFTATEF